MKRLAWSLALVMVFAIFAFHYSVVGAAAQQRDTMPNRLTGFQNPETVFYDQEQDVYFVSNMNGDMLTKDNNGFISRINASDRSIDLKWIQSGKNNVTLNSPKGIAVVGDDLWVADIDVVRRFNRRTGSVENEVPIPNSVFLNGIAAAPDGGVYVSDTGPDPKTHANAESVYAIYRIASNGNVSKLISGSVLKRPNGIVVSGSKVWTVSYGGNELLEVSGGRVNSAQMLPKGMLDGIVRLNDDTFYITSWEAGGVFHGPAAGPFKLEIQNIQQPAGIGLDQRRNLLMVPSVKENVVTIHNVSATTR